MRTPGPGVVTKDLTVLSEERLEKRRSELGSIRKRNNMG